MKDLTRPNVRPASPPDTMPTRTEHPTEAPSQSKQPGSIFTADDATTDTALKGPLALLLGGIVLALNQVLAAGIPDDTSGWIQLALGVISALIGGKMSATRMLARRIP